MMSRGKNYVEKDKTYNKLEFLNPVKAFEQLKTLTFAKFDETVEVHFNLGIDPRHAEQQIRGTVVLPHGIGKEIKILAITKGDKVKEAEDAGADIIGAEDVIEKIEKGWLDFDLVLATPDMMAKVGKVGRILGSKGLMPTPKNGTVTADLKTAIQEFKSGKIEYRNDKTGNIHVMLGKISFSNEQLLDNFQTIYDIILKVKPAKSKGIYLKSVTLCSTMSPGVRVEPTKNKWGN
ncbi:MAG: 50S ribosomal protein L1 [Candidatus Margulisiibacteriota bacterium]